MWVYGDDVVTDYNGVVVLGNWVSHYDVESKNGLLYTDFSRTISDAFANESILDMQGITEAVSRYYYANDKSLTAFPWLQNIKKGLKSWREKQLNITNHRRQTGEHFSGLP